MMASLHDRGVTIKDVDYNRRMAVRTFANDTIIFEPHKDPIRVPVAEFQRVLDILTNKESED